MQGRIKRVAGLGFIAILVVLLACNLHFLRRNQNDPGFMPDDVLAIRPRSIALLARQNAMQTVSTTFAAYHILRNQLAGTHLLLPAMLTAHKLDLERVSRLDVELGPYRIDLPSPVVQRIFDEEATIVWAMEPGNLTGAVIEPGATHYVLVQRPEDVALQVVISQDRYRRALAAAEHAGSAGSAP
jgi:hypothetical protein